MGSSIAGENVRVPPGITLFKVVGADAEALKHILAQLTVDDPVKRATTFPGPNPVSLDTHMFPLLKSQSYWITEKTDGVRYVFLMCIYKGLKIAALFDRTLTPYLLGIHNAPRAMSQGTVLDGELVHDSALGTWLYHIFDAVTVSDVPTMCMPFSQRMEAVERALTFYAPVASDSVALKLKTFLPFSAAICQQYARHLQQIEGRYKVDGIIFMPETDRICYGRHDKLFKLKEHHTLDLLARNGKLHVYDEKARRNRPVGVAVGENAYIAAVDGTIVECELVPGEKRKEREWCILHTRTDKKTANNKFTFEKTMLNISEALKLEDVVRAVFH